MPNKEMSLRKIAGELGITPAYLSYMVNGKRPWRKDLYQRYMGVVNTFVNSEGQSVNKQAETPPVSVASPDEFVPKNVGGSARESNPPTPFVTRHNGFEVRKGHRAPSTPVYLNQPFPGRSSKALPISCQSTVIFEPNFFSHRTIPSRSNAGRM